VLGLFRYLPFKNRSAPQMGANERELESKAAVNENSNGFDSGFLSAFICVHLRFSGLLPVFGFDGSGINMVCNRRIIL